MIDFVEIKNYKCFEDTKIEGFERVNLIGGLNNAGKTVLLEALHLSTEPSFENIVLHSKLRGENIELSEKPWDYLFFKNNSDVNIFIGDYLYSKGDDSHRDKQEIIDGYNYDKFDFFIAGFFVKNMPIDKKTLRNINDFKKIIPKQNNFIAPTEPFNSEKLVSDFNTVENNQQEHLIIDFLKTIDNSITDIRVSVQGGVHLRVKKNNNGLTPLTALGDAAKRVARIAITALSGDHKVIFIDEIENGIHYTAHHEFWRLLFHLAQSLDLQVFATTHSLEMIKAFHKIAVEKEVKDATYFELFRHGRTDKIVGKKQSIETLTYRLERNLELRGE